MKYPKILSIGDPLIKDLFTNEVIVEEKIDGSQFRTWFDETGKIHTGSKAVNYTDENPPDKMFLLAVEKATNLFEGKNYKNTFIICEYLTAPKQNTLTYARTPKNNLVILDVQKEGTYLSYEEKKRFAQEHDLEITPLLHKGTVSTAEELRKLLETESFLGGTKIEGVVVKNYEKTHQIPYLLGMPLMGKFVREEFKELNRQEWNVGVSFEEQVMNNFPKEARWNKAVQHLKEKGQLTGSPKDIGELLQELNQDFEQEAAEIVKQILWKKYKDKLQRLLKRGFAEWYKQRILEQTFKKKEE